ncbi:NAD-dependent epimerase/dehydratase family protein [Streptomyces paromomycinus]|uniref:dTDP-glucose 4,6-dehydratase n=1 Tax=Streptomyces paromomycinus TaxID=92743 RepID=A0A401W786_STREY|nr:NAD-dependent epimerase/dehydratase family protein [Streptomyces paromomycinus]GCD45121.1 dTDP-glucose 4,6-dehydratase [Streptomyces paromomycinus]
MTAEGVAKGGMRGVLGEAADGAAATAPRRVVVTGATGFIGSAVVRELLSFPNLNSVSARSLRLRAVARKPPEAARSPQPDTTVPVEWRAADLADPASLRGVCEGADVLLHLASDIGRDAERCELVNVRGTAALVGEAVRAGVGRIVQLSTAAVYGAGPHAGPGVGEVEPAPVSPASRTRLAAERPVLAAGGTVLRPGLVLGAGDRWVVPALAELLHRVPARWDGGRGLLSVVAVEDLARLFVRLALAPGGVPGGVHHASHPTPVRNGDLMDTLIGHGVLPRPTATAPHDGPGSGPDLSWDACLERLAAVPGRVSARQFALLASDHWYRSDEVWSAAGCDPGPGPLVRLAEAADWYRSHLQARA